MFIKQGNLDNIDVYQTGPKLPIATIRQYGNRYIYTELLSMFSANLKLFKLW